MRSREEPFMQGHIPKPLFTLKPEGGIAGVPPARTVESVPLLLWSLAIATKLLREVLKLAAVGTRMGQRDSDRFTARYFLL